MFCSTKIGHKKADINSVLLDETKAAREAYDDFFKRYPYCYGYWRKYAEFERRHKHYERCIECNQNACRVYDHAIEACGMEFRSDKLWDEYINWELSNGETVRAGALFDQILSIPTLLYSNHFDKYKAFVNSNEPDRVVSQDEYNEIFTKVETDLRNVVDGDLFLLEDYIKRPYFHVKPLERAQLRNWRAYLDFEIECGDITRIIILFERCLIACALYEEMWIKYARYVESIGESNRARSVFRRATEVHLPRKPNVHLAYSAFEEKNGNNHSNCDICDIRTGDLFFRSFIHVVKFDDKLKCYHLSADNIDSRCSIHPSTRWQRSIRNSIELGEARIIIPPFQYVDIRSAWLFILFVNERQKYLLRNLGISPDYFLDDIAASSGPVDLILTVHTETKEFNVDVNETNSLVLHCYDSTPHNFGSDSRHQD
ncbi:HAT repeat protein [Onchocerca flexuosa]|uniref:HAT repeat protein n=1 Tax=Onchocerca flexuosa TaxID=387005 RepID=A0A238BWW1_9BILA|nr:HAT repeat protein [Onchocerca flexuosa]